MRRLAAWFERATLYPAGPTTLANARASHLDAMAFNVMTGAFLPYLGPFVLALGGGPYAVSLALSLPAFVQTVSQLPAARLVRRARRRVPFIVAWSWAGRVAFLPLALLPFLPIGETVRVAVFIALYAYLSFPATVANVAWTSLMAELFPPILRGRVFADRNLWLTLASLLASLASGVIVALIGWPWHYAVLTLVTLAGQLLSIRYLAALREEPLESPPSQGGDAAPAAASDRPAGGRAAGALGWRPFWTFAAGAFVFQFGLAWPQGIWPTVFIDIDGVPVVWFGIWNTVSAFATIASVRAWGRAHDRRGPFFVAAQAALLFGLLVPFYLWVTTGPGIALLNAVGGVATAAINLALFNGLLAAAPAEARPHAVGWFNLLIGLANFAGPLLGAWQFHALGLAPTIAVAAVLRVAGAAVLVSLAPRAAWALPSLPSASAWRFALGPFVRRALGRRAENVR